MQAFPNCQASELSKKEDLEWCAGTDQLWELDGANPCKVLVSGFEQLSGTKFNGLDMLEHKFEGNLIQLENNFHDSLADSFLVRLAIRVAPWW